ncbi:hypothetical protein EC968_007672 [Mortierella alpina]|nr:hypothetical protein EC968_007672 [Mortierella alpina]
MTGTPRRNGSSHNTMPPRPELPSAPPQTRPRRAEPYPQPVAAQRTQRRSPRSAPPTDTAVHDLDFFEQLDRVMESIAEEEAGRVPRHLETGPQVQVHSFGKKRRIQRDSSNVLELTSTTRTALVSPSPSSSSFSSSSSLDMPRLHHPSNVSRPASRNQTVVPSSVHSDPSLSLMVIPSSVHSEDSPPELFDYDAPAAIARQPRPQEPHQQETHQQETAPQRETLILQQEASRQQEVPSQQETSPQQLKLQKHKTPREAAPLVARQKKPYDKKTEPMETVATRIGARRRTAASATSRGPSSSSAAPSGANVVTRRQKSVIDVDVDENLKATAPSTESASRLSNVRVYVIPLNMDKVIFNLSRQHVLQLNGTWMGPQEKVLATDPRVASTIPPLDQERTTHIVTELTNLQAVKTYLGVDTINYKKPMDAKGYSLSRLTSRPVAAESAKSPPEDTPPPSQPAAPPVATASSSTTAATTTSKEQERFAKFQSTEDGQPLQFHEIVQGIIEGSLDDTAISDAGETDENEDMDQDQEQSKVAPRDAQPQEYGQQEQDKEQYQQGDKQSPPSEKDQVLLQIINSGKSEGKRRARILYQCQSPHTAGQKEEPVYNKAILEQLKTLMDHYDTIKTKGSKEHFKVINYRKAITAIRALDYEITSEAMALKVPRVGKKIAQKIGECIALGKIKKLDHLNWDQERSGVETLFRSIYGVGSEVATDWYNKGLRTLDDVRKLPDLTKNQISGLKYYDDLLQRIPRAEVEEIGKVVSASAAKLHPDIQVHVTGSYRRGQPDCGDIDMVVARPDIDFGGDLFVIMDHILKDLISQGFLVDHLSLPVWSDDMEGQMKHFKYMGICKLPGEGHVHHHIDILVVPWMHLGAVLLYFTGNDICNRSMRLLASNRGMRLSDKGLFAGVIRGKNRKKINEGHWVAGRTEKEIFDYLKIKYLEPHEREC